MHAACPNRERYPTLQEEVHGGRGIIGAHSRNCDFFFLFLACSAPSAWKSPVACACEKLGLLDGSLWFDTSGEDGVLEDGESGSSAASNVSACAPSRTR